MEVAAGQSEDRLRVWLLLLLAVFVYVAGWIGIVLGLLPSYPISLHAELVLNASWDQGGVVLIYLGILPVAFVLWGLSLIPVPPRLTTPYLAAIGLLALLNLIWILLTGGADLRTFLGMAIGVLVPVLLLGAGMALRQPLRAGGVLVHGALSFAWFGIGAFPDLSPRT